jgi:hypothetical protein
MIDELVLKHWQRGNPETNVGGDGDEGGFRKRPPIASAGGTGTSRLPGPGTSSTSPHSSKGGTYLHSTISVDTTMATTYPLRLPADKPLVTLTHRMYRLPPSRPPAQQVVQPSQQSGCSNCTTVQTRASRTRSLLQACSPLSTPSSVNGVIAGVVRMRRTRASARVRLSSSGTAARTSSSPTVSCACLLHRHN